MNYKDLPQKRTDREVAIQKFWKDFGIFEKSVEAPAGIVSKSEVKNYSFYDGPPFATGLPHHGHIMAGTVKDAIPRYRTMRGYSVRRVWGWDCHGLPIENMVEKELGLNSKKEIQEFGINKFNHIAENSVLKYEDEWKEIIPRLGRFVDMNHPYKTMDWTFTESVWWSWKTLSDKGLAYEGHKMMHICPRCETPLAQSEVGMEYHDITDMTVTAEFELVDEPNTFLLAWTTTPWTLPGNTALAVNKDIDYVIVSSTFDGKTSKFIVAKNRYEEIFKASSEKEIIKEIKGSDIVGKKYKPLFDYYQNIDLANKENIYKIWHADFIKDDTGTGIAHEAPAFGAEDMELAKANNIPVIKHVNMDGSFTAEVVDFPGLKVKAKDDSMSTDIEVVKWLAHNGKLFEKHKIVHSYPLCWRCKTPLLNYATSGWFVDVPKLKNRLLEENGKVSWAPSHVQNGRFGKWLEGAREWAVSRTRYWGAPLPVWRCEETKEIKVIGSLEELRKHIKNNNKYVAIRHGEAISNVESFIDSEGLETNTLTEKGVEQIKQAVKDLGHFDIIVTSPLKRAMQSAEIAQEICGGDIVVDDRLREKGFGEFNGKKVLEWMSSKERDIINDNLDKSISGIESRNDVKRRAVLAFMDLEKKYSGKRILIVSHGATIYMLNTALNGLSDAEIRSKMKDDKESWLPGNASVIDLPDTRLVYDDQGNINLHRPFIDEVVIIEDSKEFRRIPDVFDCWYESGSMPYGSLHYPFENKEVFDKTFPADWIAESLDQTRGWFYSLIVLGVGLFDKSPYKAVNVNGLIMASNGEKMSKSLKNYADPMDMVEKFGADTLRHYLLSTPVMNGENINFSESLLDEVHKKTISRIENCVSFYTMVKAGTDSSDIINSGTSNHVLDVWMKERVNQVTEIFINGYDNYQIDKAVRAVDSLVEDLSLWYVRRSRERFRTDNMVEKHEALKAYAEILYKLSLMLAPSTPFIAEYLYQVTKEDLGLNFESVHLAKIDNPSPANVGVIEEMEKARMLVTNILEERTKAKIPVKIPIRNVVLVDDLSKAIMDEIKEEANIWNVSFGDSFAVDTTIDEEMKRIGDIRTIGRAIQDKRKSVGLVSSDVIDLSISGVHFRDDEVERLSKKCGIENISYDKILDHMDDISLDTLENVSFSISKK